MPQSDLCRNFVYYCRAQVTHIKISDQANLVHHWCVFMCLLFFPQCVVYVCFENTSAACISRSPYPNYFLSYYPKILFGLFYVCTERFRIQEHLDTSALSTVSASVPSCSWYLFLHTFDISSNCKPVSWVILQSDFLNITLCPCGFPSSYILSFNEHCKPVCSCGFPSLYILLA